MFSLCDNRRISLLGGQGKIGSFLSTHLKGKGFEVTSHDLLSNINELMGFNPSIIINCLGRGSDIRFPFSDYEIWNSNFYLPSEYLEFAANRGISFISLGSLLEKEVDFLSAYIESKRALTSMISSMHALGAKATSILVPIVYGVRIEHVLITDIINAIKLNQPVKLESPNAVREFINIQDLVRIIEKLIHKEFLEVSSFEIGNGIGYELSDLCNQVLKDRVNPTWVSTPSEERTNNFKIVADDFFLSKKLGVTLRSNLIDWLQAKKI